MITPMITKTHDAFKYLKYWREHGMVCDFEVTYSCLCILDVRVISHSAATPPRVHRSGVAAVILPYGEPLPK